MQRVAIKEVDGMVNITVTETPQFIVPHLNPLQVLAIRASSHKLHSVVVAWQVTADTAVSYFEIERKDTLSGHFARIATVSSLGNNTNEPQYQYEDAQAYTGKNWYRVKIIQKNGKTFYTNATSVYAGELSAYPNPFSQHITVVGLLPGKNNQLQLFSTNGKLVAATNTYNASLNWHVGNLSDGLYYLIYTLDNGTKKHVSLLKN
jgi:hypothetical protein